MIFIPCSPDDISAVVADDGKSITFYPCGRTSHNPNDVEKRYCAACHRWMDLLELARRMKAEAGWSDRGNAGGG